MKLGKTSKIINTHSMKGYDIDYLKHENDLKSIVKLCMKITRQGRVFSVKPGIACEVISML